MIASPEAFRELCWYTEVKVPLHMVTGANWERVVRTDIGHRRKM